MIHSSACPQWRADQPGHAGKSGDQCTPATPRSGTPSTSYERVGVAWVNDNGSIYVKLHGTQVISNFMLYAMDQEDDQAGDKAGE